MKPQPISLPAQSPSALRFVMAVATSFGLTFGSSAETIELISINSDGSAPGNGESIEGSISEDQRFVAFTSTATDLVSGIEMIGEQNVYVRDRLEQTTQLVSVAEDGLSSGNGSSSLPSLSANGRFVSFSSTATNLVAETDDNGVADVFVRDLQLNTTTLVSTRLQGGFADGESLRSAISGDGTRIAFDTTATNILASPLESGSNIYLRDFASGSTSLVSDLVPTTEETSSHPSISNDGNLVSFNADVDAFNAPSAIYARRIDEQENIVVSIGPTGLPAFSERRSFTSGDGRFVSYTSSSINLLPEQVPLNSVLGDVFIRDLARLENRLVSVNMNGEGASGFADGSSLSNDGRFVAFISDADDLVEGDTPFTAELFIRDMVLETTERFAPTPGVLRPTAITQNGQNVLFVSEDATLANLDTNQAADVFVVEREFTGPIFAATLPSSRSVQVGQTATAFATIINAGDIDATNCQLSPNTQLPVDFFFQTTDPANALVGDPNTPVDIPAGAAQNFIFGLTPTAPITTTQFFLDYACANSPTALRVQGLNLSLIHI